MCWFTLLLCSLQKTEALLCTIQLLLYTLILAYHICMFIYTLYTYTNTQYNIRTCTNISKIFKHVLLTVQPIIYGHYTYSVSPTLQYNYSLSFGELQVGWNREASYTHCTYWESLNSTSVLLPFLITRL